MSNLASIVDQIKNLSPSEQIVLIKLIDSHPLKKHPLYWITIGVVIAIVYVYLTYELRYYCIKKTDLQVTKK